MKKTLSSLIAVVAVFSTGTAAAQNSTGTQTNAPVVPGPDGLIHLQAKPEMVDLIPTLAVATLRRAVEFYSSKLGFELIMQSGNYVAVGRDGVQIGFVADKNSTKGYKPSFYIQMVRIDDFYKQVNAAGTKLNSELKTSPTNMREFSLTDPDGYTLIFGEYMGPK